ncbi:MAG: YjjG family noncanonical pyrimidine nucleotidase [Spirochaetales bacterium]|nr:YjjG family noncanonical pyrimidine nucleotidase [Spirochaetales bacterium]
MNKNYPVVFFDADDTLFDYQAAEAYALSQVLSLSAITVEEDILKAYRDINSRLWRLKEEGRIATEELRVLRFKRLFETLGLGPEGAWEEASTRYLEFLGNAGFLIKGAEEVCRVFFYGGVRLVLVTNGIKEVQHSRLAVSGLGSFFNKVIISDEAGAAKPAKEFFDYTFRVCGLSDAARVLLVGDSITADIKGGNDYGIDTCWYNPRGLPHPQDIVPQYQVSDLESLKALVFTQAI